MCVRQYTHAQGPQGCVLDFPVARLKHPGYLGWSPAAPVWGLAGSFDGSDTGGTVVGADGGLRRYIPV